MPVPSHLLARRSSLEVRDLERELKSRFKIEHATVAVDWNDETEPCSLSQTFVSDRTRT
nr:hypothetical protein [Pseudomonas sp.]